MQTQTKKKKEDIYHDDDLRRRAVFVKSSRRQIRSGQARSDQRGKQTRPRVERRERILAEVVFMLHCLAL